MNTHELDHHAQRPRERGKENGLRTLCLCLSRGRTLRGKLHATSDVRTHGLCVQSQAPDAAADAKKLHMTVNMDGITGEIKVRFDRKPVATAEWDLITDLKKWNFRWTGFGDEGKWSSDKLAALAFNEKPFRARIKLACDALSFFDHNGKSISMADFIVAAKDFDPDSVDDDLSTLSPSKVPPTPPQNGKKRKAD